MFNYIMVTMNKTRQDLEAERKQVLKKMLQLGPWIQGMVVEVLRICGTKGCACHKGGPKHPAMYVTTKQDGKTVSLYVPRRMEAEVKTWAENFVAFKELMSEASDLQRQIIRLREDVKRQS